MRLRDLIRRLDRREREARRSGIDTDSYLGHGDTAARDAGSWSVSMRCDELRAVLDAARKWQRARLLLRYATCDLVNEDDVDEWERERKRLLKGGAR